jgi:hypothetical protein
MFLQYINALHLPGSGTHVPFTTKGSIDTATMESNDTCAGGNLPWPIIWSNNDNQTAFWEHEQQASTGASEIRHGNMQTYAHNEDSPGKSSTPVPRLVIDVPRSVRAERSLSTQSMREL